jgi:NtrC-family two-component system response regulator AlgB
VERAVILCPGEEIGVDYLPFASLPTALVAGLTTPRAGDAVTLEALERAHIESVLGSAATLDIAARILGIDASTLYRKRKAYGLT